MKLVISSNYIGCTVCMYFTVQYIGIALDVVNTVNSSETIVCDFNLGTREVNSLLCSNGTNGYSQMFIRALSDAILTCCRAHCTVSVQKACAFFKNNPLCGNHVRFRIQINNFFLTTNIIVNN